MRGTRQNREAGFWQPVDIPHFSTALGAKQFQCMLISHAVGVANGHKYRSLYVFYVFGPVIRLQIDADDLLDKLREMGRIVSKAFVLFLYGRAFEHIRGESSKTGLDLGPPPVVRVGT